MRCTVIWETGQTGIAAPAGGCSLVGLTPNQGTQPSPSLYSEFVTPDRIQASPAASTASSF